MSLYIQSVSPRVLSRHPSSILNTKTALSTLFLAIANDIKRKGLNGEQNDESIIPSNNSNNEFGKETIDSLDENESDPNRRCVDLIVLGISYRSVEADVKKCFEAFGELIFCEVKISEYIMIDRSYKVIEFLSY